MGAEKREARTRLRDRHLCDMFQVHSLPSFRRAVTAPRPPTDAGCDRHGMGTGNCSRVRSDGRNGSSRGVSCHDGSLRAPRPSKLSRFPGTDLDATFGLALSIERHQSQFATVTDYRGVLNCALHSMATLGNVSRAPFRPRTGNDRRFPCATDMPFLALRLSPPLRCHRAAWPNNCLLWQTVGPKRSPPYFADCGPHHHVRWLLAGRQIIKAGGGSPRRG